MAEMNFTKLKKDKRKKLDQGASVFVVTMLFIPIFSFLVYWVFVNFRSVLLAFQTPASNEFTLINFQAAISNVLNFDKLSPVSISTSLKNTFIYLVKDILFIFFQLFIGYFFYRRICFTRGFQIILYLPMIVSGVVMSTMFSSFIRPSGPLGTLLHALGVEEVPQFLQNSDYANGTIIFYTLWMGWGGNMLLMSGAYARIPLEIIESARLDGIGMIREFFKIIFPLTWATVSTLIVLTMTGMFSNSGPVLLFTQGSYGTSTMGYWIYHRVYFDGVSAYNEVSAAGLMLTLIGAPIILFVKWLIERVPVAEF